jgi:hypothetical protein
MMSSPAASSSLLKGNLFSYLLAEHPRYYEKAFSFGEVATP